MSDLPNVRRRFKRLTLFLTCLVSGLGGLTGCGTAPRSRNLERQVNLPVPASVKATPRAGRLRPTDDQGEYVLSARTLIPVAFHRQPDIKSSFQRFKSEEARYDFFYATRDSLTPKVRVANDFNEERDRLEVERERAHNVELGVEKLFFDTTTLDLGLGYRTEAVDQAIGNQPYVTASLRYPLWASRERLERTSAEIFQRNELNDAQLAYIQLVRRQLRDVLYRYYDVTRLARTVHNAECWEEDLSKLAEEMILPGRPTDRARVETEIASVHATVRNTAGRYEIDFARLKAAVGLPFFADVTLVDEPFNPFAGSTHEELLQLTIDTDPEIETLRNAMRNAEVQLDLARRGRWDVAFLMNGASELEGRGETEGQSEWKVSVGLDVSAIDPRVVESLAREARSDIARFGQAITARENRIFVDTLEPLVRIDTLGASRDELLANLPRVEGNYADGLRAYKDGRLSIDNLLKRRRDIFDRQEEVSYLTFMVGANVAELCAATGLFFELLREMDPSTPAALTGDSPGIGPRSNTTLLPGGVSLPQSTPSAPSAEANPTEAAIAG